MREPYHLSERIQLNNKPMKVIKRITPEIQSFLDDVRAGIEFWVSAGKKLVSLVESNPDVFEIIVAHSSLKFEQLVTFERIGRGELYPQLLLDDGHAAKRVLSLGLPYDKQVEIYEKPIPVVTLRNGTPTVEHKRLHELTAQEAQRAINFDGVRPVEEQKEIVSSKINRAKSARYRVEENGIRWFAYNHFFTWAQMEEIMLRRPRLNGASIADAITRNQIRP